MDSETIAISAVRTIHFHDHRPVQVVSDVRVKCSTYEAMHALLALRKLRREYEW